MPPASRPKIALVLSGGGARAAYQVGVMKYISEHVRHNRSPFDIICGTSAGAINATVVAAGTYHFKGMVRDLESVWANFSCDQVYRTDFRGVTLTFGRFAKTALFGPGYNSFRPYSLLDNTPLRKMLSKVIDFSMIDYAIERGNLQALSITASGYTSGESVCFFQAGPNIHNWRRPHRLGVRTKLNLDHLLASSAIPAIFPAVRLNREYFGDGAIRQLAPLSPALHLGANKLFVVGVSDNRGEHARREKVQGAPSIGQMVGHVFNSAFIDTLEGDIERLLRINKTLSYLPKEMLATPDMPLKPIELCEISPSEPLNAIASRHESELPHMLKWLVQKKKDKASETDGAGILSYLLFESGFCKDLIDHGYEDAKARHDELLTFFDNRLLDHKT